MSGSEPRVGARGATLKDVALAAQVTPGTVSVVLNGAKSGTIVSASTRQRIVEIAREMGYRPNELARSLHRSRSMLVGFYAEYQSVSVERHFITEIVGGIQDGCAELGLDVVLHSQPDNSRNEIARLVDRRVDGLIVFSPPANAAAATISAHHVPAVAVSEDTPDSPVVGVQNYEGGRLIAEHLASKGYRRAIYRDWILPSVSAAERRSGFTAISSTLGLEVFAGRRVEANESFELSNEEKELIVPGATAFVCWNDECAYGTLLELDRLGYQIPDDVGVTGYNGLHPGIPLRWDLTTIVAPWRQVGAKAVHVLNNIIVGRETGHRIDLPIELAIGHTT